MSIKLFAKIIEASLIIFTVYLSLYNFNNFFFFYKNFQNKNLLFKTSEYQTLKGLHEKILIYGLYLENNFSKHTKRLSAGDLGFISVGNSSTSSRNGYDISEFPPKNFEKSFLNIFFTHISDNLKPNKDNLYNSFQEYEELIKANLLMKGHKNFRSLSSSNSDKNKNIIFSANEKIAMGNNSSRGFITTHNNSDSKINDDEHREKIFNQEYYYKFNIEDRAFNSILSHNLAEALKAYLIIIVYFLIKVKHFIILGR